MYFPGNTAGKGELTALGVQPKEEAPAPMLEEERSSMMMDPLCRTVCAIQSFVKVLTAMFAL